MTGKEKRNHKRSIKSAISFFLTIAAAAILIATFFLPLLQIYGESMTPTLREGEIVLCLKKTGFKRQDMVAFYYNNKILVKRIIACPGEWVDIDAAGNVMVNGVWLQEPYVSEKALGECDLKFPYQVPEGRFFVLGDHRMISADSRNPEIGCVSKEQLLGKLVFRIWPLQRLGGLAFGKAVDS